MEIYHQAISLSEILFNRLLGKNAERNNSESHGKWPHVHFEIDLDHIIQRKALDIPLIFVEENNYCTNFAFRDIEDFFSPNVLSPPPKLTF